MSPAGNRRRLSSFSLVLPFLFLFFSTASAVSSAVVGIDIGTEYIKAALVKPGVPLDIVLTKDSKRKETAAVAFKPSKDAEGFPERIYGGDAVALAARFPKDVYANLKPLLGLKQGSDAAKEYSSRYPELHIVESPKTDAISFKSNSFVGEHEAFLIEEVLAMMLKNVKSNAETMAGKVHTVEDAVVTIPPFFSSQERQAVTTAAELAGLRVLSLLTDGLAIGLNYATSRQFPIVNEGGTPETHLVFDSGAASTSATVMRFQGRVVKDVGKFNKTIQEVHVIGSGWEKNLGGDAMNGLILDDMVIKFTEGAAARKANVSPEQLRAHGRTMAKLWKEAERIRQILSANSEAQSSFESLYSDDLNFKYKLSRTTFEIMASGEQERVQVPIKKALEMAKLSIHDIDSIILHGGLVRTPFVQKQLENLVSKDKIRTSVNADEASALGAGFRAATISPSFRVKEIRPFDIGYYPILATTSEGKQKTQKLFLPTSITGPSKQVTFKINADFEFALSQQLSSDQIVLISKFKTLNLTDSLRSLSSQGCMKEVNPTFAIRLSPLNGLPEVVSGSVSCELQPPEKKGVVDGMKDLLGFGSKKDDQKPINNDEDESLSPSTVGTSSSASASESVTSSAETSSSSKAAEKSSKALETPKEPTKKLITIPLSISTESGSTSNINTKNLQRIRDRLNAFDSSDRSRVLRDSALNSLEAYTYILRDLIIEDGFVAASTAEQREQISQKSSEVSAWLYEDGVDAPRDVLKKKLDELRRLVKPIEQRKDEAVKRPEAIKKLEDSLNQAETISRVMKQYLEIQSSSEAASSSPSSTSPTEAVSSSATTDEFSDLDEEPITSTTTTSTAPTPDTKPIYSEADLTLIDDTRSTIINWLDNARAEQERLSPTEDPFVFSSDIEAKANEVSDLATSLLMKQMQAPKKPKTKSAKKKTSSRTASASNASNEPESAAAPAEPNSTIAKEAEPSPEQSAETSISGTDQGGWQQHSSVPEPEHGQAINMEEEMRIRDAQMSIDRELAQEQASIVAKNKANQTKKSKTKPTSKPKKTSTKGKAKAKSSSKPRTSKSKEKSEGHSEL